MADGRSALPPTILKSTIYGYTAGLVYFASSLLSHIIISRWCGPAILGEYFFVITINAAITNFASLGIGFSNSTFLARKEHTLSEMNFVSLFFSVLVGSLCALSFQIIEMIYPQLFSSQNAGGLRIALGLLPFTMYMRYWNTMMVGLNRVPTLSKVLSITSMLWNLLIILAVILGWGLNGLYVVWGIYLLSSIILMAGLTFKEGGQPRYLPGLLRKALVFGVKGNLGEIATELWKKMDVFLLYHYSGASGVGIYSVAATIIEKLNQVATPIRIAITPGISGGEREESVRLAAKASRQILAGAALFSAILILTGGKLIGLMYGPVYDSSVLPLRILCIGTIGSSVAGVLSIFFIGQLKRPGLLSILAWINVVISLLLCLSLIPDYGYFGAACSAAATTLMGAVILVLIYWKLTGNSPSSLLLLRREDLKELLGLLSRLKLRK